MTDVDLGPCRARVYDRGADRWAVILPGAMYLPDAPLLWFAREACLAAGRNVLAVWDTFDQRTDPQRWVDERLEAALDRVADKTPLIIAKSLTTLAAADVARCGVPAAWLTPLIGRAGTPYATVVIDGLRASAAPCLLIGGTADPSWDSAVAHSIPRARVVEVADADHTLQVPGNVARSIDALRTIAEAIEVFAHESGQRA